jgi:hypothetical protein
MVAETTQAKQHEVGRPQDDYNSLCSSLLQRLGEWVNFRAFQKPLFSLLKLIAALGNE